MRAILSAALATVLLASVSACHFKYGNQWVDCDDKGSHCAASPSSTPTVAPTVAPTIAPTPAPTPTPGQGNGGGA
jgi:hypothetical protein